MNYDLKSILAEAQKLQLESLGTRQICVNVYTGIVNVAIFESNYDNVEDGDVKNFSFYASDSEDANKKTWKELNDYYING